MIRSTSRSIVILPLAAAAALVAGCGSSSSSSSTTAAGAGTSTTTSASSSGQGSAPAFDSCLAGTWKASKNTLTYPDNGTNVALSGGAGEVLTVATDATFKDDYSNAAPLTGTAGSSNYTATYAGTVTGKLTITAAGSVTATIDDTSKANVTLTKDGTTVATVHPPTTETATYTCTAGSSLVVTGSGGGVTTYGPG